MKKDIEEKNLMEYNLQIWAYSTQQTSAIQEQKGASSLKSEWPHQWQSAAESYANNLEPSMALNPIYELLF